MRKGGGTRVAYTGGGGSSSAAVAAVAALDSVGCAAASSAAAGVSATGLVCAGTSKDLGASLAGAVGAATGTTTGYPVGTEAVVTLPAGVTAAIVAGVVGAMARGDAAGEVALGTDARAGEVAGPGRKASRAGALSHATGTTGDVPGSLRTSKAVTCCDKGKAIDAAEAGTSRLGSRLASRLRPSGVRCAAQVPSTTACSSAAPATAHAASDGRRPGDHGGRAMSGAECCGRMGRWCHRLGAAGEDCVDSTETLTILKRNGLPRACTCATMAS